MSLPSVDNLKNDKLVCLSPLVTPTLSQDGSYLSGAHYSKHGSKLCIQIFCLVVS
jgi:hypothetical protein